MNLRLPEMAVSDRVSVTPALTAGETRTAARLDGPGCIKHIWLGVSDAPGHRDVVLRIYFDEEPVPYVEAPIGDFFGVMHGLKYYPINTRYLSVQARSAVNCYFPMPFASSARIELEAGERGHGVSMQVDWHRYPGQKMEERRRFCARWRREMPAQRHGEDFVMLDADGPGQLVGFVYGVRLLDDVDRWSHGGADNIYIDGDGDNPAYIRGIGGEDTFGTGSGGALHPPASHLYAEMPYYEYVDVGDARAAQSLVGYRFFQHDEILFHDSIHMRFGSMRNDICATTYWYQETPVRPFYEMPPAPERRPGVELPRGTYDLPLPTGGEWWLCGPFGNQLNRAVETELSAESVFEPGAIYDGMHEEGSPWVRVVAGTYSSDVSIPSFVMAEEDKRNAARWVTRSAFHGFVDFNHVFRPPVRGVAGTHSGVAIARCVLRAPTETTARLRVAWDDHLVLRVNDDQRFDLGYHSAFRAQTVDVQLRPGENVVVVKLSNVSNGGVPSSDEVESSNHGGWAFAFQATSRDGAALVPRTR